jgi:ribosomal protein S27AE
MTKHIERMQCRDCGVDMNPHAVKVSEPRTAEEAAHVDPDLGGVVREIHTCPECGDVAARWVG